MRQDEVAKNSAFCCLCLFQLHNSCMRVKTVRCILDRDNRYLLAVHNNNLPQTMGKWGLPGGGIEPGEAFELALTRELKEELALDLQGFLEIGDYTYRDSQHKVFAVRYSGYERLEFDKNEILQLAWFSFDDVVSLHEADKLHTGFECAAINRYRTLKKTQHK